MRGTFAWLCLALSALALAPGCGGCGDDAATGPDAEEPDAEGDTDAPTTAASSPEGVYRALPTVTLTADEAATIYYTVDGSAPSTSSTSDASPVTVSGLVGGTSLRFFAVDDAGNEETPQELLYALDRLGPAPVASFAADADGNDVDLTWVNPTADGFARVVVARVTDVSTTLAADGSDYAVADTLGASTIVYVGNGATFTDTARGPGHHTYLAWAQYDTDVYAEGRTAAARVATPTQTCQISVDVTGGTATVSTQPANFTLAVSGYANAAGAITFDVAMTSGLAGVTFNPKLAITAVNGTGGTPTVTNETGTMDLGGTVDYFYYGPEGMLSGASAARPFAITAGGATAFTLDCAVVEDVGVFYTEWNCPLAPDDGGGMFDPRTVTLTGGMAPASRLGATGQNRTPTTNCSAWQSLVLSPDQRYLYAGPRSGKLVAKIDTTTLASVGGLDVTVAGTSASAGRLSLDPSGRRLYVGVNDGSHGGGYAAGNSATATVLNLVLEVATAAMTETSRTQVGSGDAEHRLLRATLSPDGRTVGVTIGSNFIATPNSEVHFYDTSTWTERDADTQTAGVQPFAIGTLRATNLAFDATGRYVVIGSGGDSDTELTFGLVDLDSMTLQVLDTPETSTGPRILSATWDGDAFLLWASQQSQLHRLAPSTGVITSVGTAGDADLDSPAVSARVGDQLWIQADGGFYIVNATTGVLQTTLVGPENTHTFPITR